MVSIHNDCRGIPAVLVLLLLLPPNFPPSSSCILPFLSPFSITYPLILADATSPVTPSTKPTAPMPPSKTVKPSPPTPSAALPPTLLDIPDVNVAVILTDSTFSSFLRSNVIVLVLFYAPWCYWSRLALPEFEAAARLLSHHDPPVRLAQIDTTQSRSVARSEAIREFPTLRLYLENNTVPFIPFTGDRHRSSIVHWVDSHLMKDKAIASKEYIDEVLLPHHQQVVVLGIFPPSPLSTSAPPTQHAGVRKPPPAPSTVSPHSPPSASTSAELLVPYDGVSFMRVAREFGENIIFAHTNQTDLQAHFEAKHLLPALSTASVAAARRPPVLPSAVAAPPPPYVVLFSPHKHEQSVHLFPHHPREMEALRDFVKKFEFPAVVPFTLQRASRIFEDGRALCVLIVDSTAHGMEAAEVLKERQNEEETSLDDADRHALHHEMHEEMLSGKAKGATEAEKVFRDVAQMNRGDFLFTIAGNSEAHEKRLMALVGIDDDAVPSVRIVTFNPHGHGQFHPALKYRPDDVPHRPTQPLSPSAPHLAISFDMLQSFLTSFMRKEISPYLKSEPVPDEADNSGPVRVVVGTTFNAEVRDRARDFFVDFYAPWCGHCRKLEPNLKEMGRRLKSVPGIRLAKIDATRNEINDLMFTGYPTLMFFAAGKKDSPVTYQGDRSVGHMMRWIRERTSFAFDVEALLAMDLSSGGKSEMYSSSGDLILEEL